MIYKLTASILACLMLVVSATSQAGLHFCKCEKVMFMGECPCDGISELKEVTPCSCCENSDQPATENPLPCDDCDLTIELEFDECVPTTGNDVKVSSEQSGKTLKACFSSHEFRLTDNEVTLLEICGGPPPNVLSDSSSLYLRHSVFLI